MGPRNSTHKGLLRVRNSWKGCQVVEVVREDDRQIMLEILDQLNHLFMEGIQALMTTSWYVAMPEHKDIGVAFFTYGIILEPISNHLLGYTNPVQAKQQ